ncbi:bidirectional sugar transporter SWEET4-like [Aegilops tauschii subsp. strangulata]|nr:bidirectional sugar transporter SWEET4-like [Aegilops tauschii subsp. strangulata]XP_044329554.1 bidirectional sugar transporter SWEET4-like [Triticum aestivum]
MARFNDSGIKRSTLMVLFVLFLVDDFVIIAVVVAMSEVAAGSSTESAGSSAVAVLGVAGNLIAIINILSPTFTFVIPVWKEGSVGDRMVYGSLLAFVNNVMWAMYAASDSLESKLYFFIVNGVGLVFQICYNILYIYYAEGKKSIQAFILLLASYVVALVMAALVPWMVMTQRWSSTWVGVLAASFGVSIHIASAWDMLMVIKRKEQIIYIDRIITVSFSLAAACIWTVYGFKSATVNLYVLVPNLVGILCTAVQICVYAYLILSRKIRIYSFQTDDAVDYGYEMGKLFALPPV